MKKRILAILLCLSMAINLFPTAVYAGVGEIFYVSADNLTFKVLTEDTANNIYTVEVASNQSSSGYVTIPSTATHNGITYTVTRIGSEAFINNMFLNFVTIPASVTSIGDRAFYNCIDLTTVTIPASVTSIGNNAFFGCTNLDSVTIPAGVTSLENYAFSGCTNLDSVTIPVGVTSIGYMSFIGCGSLSSVTIPASVTNIGPYAFADCTSLATVFFDGSTPPSIGVGALDGIPITTYTVPLGTIPAYKDVLPDGVTIQADPTANISAVEVNPSSINVIQGSTRNFSATVSGMGSFTQAVAWDVTGVGSSGTTVDADGTLIVAADEPVGSLTIKAISVADPSKFAEATVTIVDSNPPAVTSVAPTGNSAPISGNIIITFDEVMDTAVSGAVYLSGNGGINYDSALIGGVWSASDTVYTIGYTTLAYNTTYTVKIEGFRDAAGNEMTANTSHSFTTEIEPLAPSVSPGNLSIIKGRTGSFTIALGQGIAAATIADITVDNGGIASVDQTHITSPGGITVTGLSAGNTDIHVAFNDTANTTQTLSVLVQAVAPIWPSDSTPSKPAYTADINADDRGDTTLPITVHEDTGNASVNVGAQQGNIISEGGNVTVTMPSIPGASRYTLGIPVAYLSTPDGNGTLIFNTDTGSLTLPADMLSGIAGEGSRAEITIARGEKAALSESAIAAIGDRPLISIALMLDGKQTEWNNPGAPVTISIPYQPTAEELLNPESIIIWYIDGSGRLNCLPNGHYDPGRVGGQAARLTTGPETGTVTFQTIHFSLYAAGYNPISFNDVAADAGYYDAVRFIAARGITGGTGGGKFSPDTRLTRGDFMVLMMKAYGIAPDTNPTDNFKDAGITYYTGYLAAAKRLRISAGIGGNLYAPGKAITCQEMFTMLYNALKAIDAMTLFVESGIADVNSGKLKPTSTITRAELAQLLYKLLSK